MDCLFCRIVAKEIPAEVVYEDNDVLALLDIEPKAPGHTMVIPKEHSVDLENLTDAAIGPLFMAVKKVAGMVLKGVKSDGLTIGINQGEAGGQAVDHLHIHIIPRFHDDNGGSIHSIVHNKPKESQKDIALKIKSVQ
jgi:histidine triad (HIT) family protein